MRVDGSSNLGMFDTKHLQINTPQEKQTTNEIQENNNSNPFLANSSQLNTEKVDKMVKDFEKKLLEEMGYEPKTIAKIKNLSEGYRIELLDEMRKSMNANSMNKILNDDISASQTVATYLHTPTNARFYIQELMA